MSEIKALLDSLRAMELPKGAEALISSIGTKASDLERDRDDLRGKVEERQKEKAKLTDRAQAAEAKVTDLEGKLPKDGTVSVSKTDADLLESYKPLGTPEELKSAKSEASTLKRAALISDAAGKTYNPKALGAHLPEGATLEAKKTTQDGKETTLYEVVEGETRTGLEAWVTSKEAELDYVQFRVPEPGKPPVFTGRGSPGGKPVDSVSAYIEERKKKE